MYVNVGNYEGYACEHLVAFDLLTKQVTTSLPSIPGTPYDLIADVEGNLFKVQVKLSKCIGNKLVVDYRKSHGERKYSRKDFDVLAAVDLERRAIAYIPPVVWSGKTQITLWRENPLTLNGFGKNQQPTLFSDFLELPSMEAIA